MQQQVRRIGDEYLVVIPTDEVERLGITEGQTVEFNVRPIATRRLSPELRAALMETWEEDRAAYEYLAGR